MKKLKIAINGFGRIGRNVLRAFLENFNHQTSTAPFRIVAINDIADPATLLHLFNYDSTHGRLSTLGVKAELDGNTLHLHTTHRTLSISLLQESSPANLPWGELDIDIVLECTGKYRDYQGASLHRTAGAKQVIVGAAPFDKVDACIVMGVNDEILTPDLPIISGVSCTTQALVPLLWVLDTAFGVESAMLTEVHAVTADQTVLDTAHRDLRRARASGHNIIPTTSSSIKASLQVLPQMAGKLDGYSIRVPTINVAMIDLTVILSQEIPLNELKTLLKSTSQTTLAGIMDYTDEPLVSSDFIHNPHSLIIDGEQMMATSQQVKIVAWYDNEWGYANRLLEMCQKLAKSL